ncbi:MAG TPA: extracellular solute-binding protein [Candidatus Binatia bacterium]
MTATWFPRVLLASIVLSVGISHAQTESLDELHKKALKEGGTVNFYASLAQINAEKILPQFEKRFPGMKINHVDGTSDKLAARIIAEARGGRTIVDVLEFSIEDVRNVYSQGILSEKSIPEAAAYPADLKGSFWVANNLIYITGAWNTEKVKKGEEPKALDEFGDPKWKDRLIAEPRDIEMLIGLTHKFKSVEKAREVLVRIAGNNVEFHKGHSDLAELLVAGQAGACLTCYTHHYPLRIRKGAPVGYMLTEGVATIIPSAMPKNPPHPFSALLYSRWSASEEGQGAYARGGRNPAHPKVEPTDKIRPATIYPVGVDDLKEFTKYEKIWKEVFKLR